MNKHKEYKHLALLYRDRAALYQSRIALKYKKQNAAHWQDISWIDLIENSDALAKALMSENIQHFSNVGIFSRNMPEWTISDIALMSIRAVSVPLYATDSVSQIEYIIKETDMKLIFVGEQEQYDKMLEVIAKLGIILKIITFDDTIDLKGNVNAMHFSDFLNKGRQENDEELNLRLSEVDLEDVVTIIYTSGTTGVPKGVVLRQKNFLNSFKIHDMFLDISEKDVTLAFLPFSHIFERTWTLMALHNGMTNYYLLNPKEVVEVMAEVKPTIMCAVPRFFEKTYSAVVEQLEAYSPLKKRIFKWAIQIGEKIMEHKRTFENISFFEKIQYSIADALVLKKGRAALGGNIRFMPCGGAALSDDINRFFQSVGIHIKYAYGMTETIATITVFGDAGFKFGTVGKPLHGVELRIGENNEIQIKGDSVFSEYYKKPAETAQAFEDGWFKTGDAGAIDEEGFLIMTERIKDLIKTSSGKYVAPQLVEMKLIADAYIEQAVVIGDNRKFCVALVVPVFSILEKYAKSENIQYNDHSALIQNKQIIQFYQKRINELLDDLAEYQKVVRFTLLPNDFSILSGEYTPTLKTKRKFIGEKYKEVIEEMYR